MGSGAGGATAGTGLSWVPVADPVQQPWLTDVEVVLGTDARPELVRWSSLYPRTNGTADGYALRTADGLVLVDPVDVAPRDAPRLGALLSRMAGGAPPAASVLTYTLHERAAGRIRRGHGTPVWAPHGRQEELDEAPDATYGDGAALPGGLRAVTVTDHHAPAGPAGESFLLWAAAGRPRVLFAYDRIIGRVLSSEDDYAPALGVPGPLLWLRRAWLGTTEDEAAAARAVFCRGMRRLLDEDFDLVCPGHGALVLRNDPKGAIGRVLARGRPVDPSFIAPPSA